MKKVFAALAACACMVVLCSVSRAQTPSRLDVLLAGAKDSNDSLRKSAIRAMAEVKDPRVVDALIELSCDPSTEIRELAVESMAAVATPKCFAALVSALADSNDRTRMHAARALGALKDPRAIEPLMELLGTHRYEYDSYGRGTNVAAVIANFGDQAVAPVAKALQTRIAMRASLIQILMTINTKASQAELAKAAAADDWRLRLAVVEAASRYDARGMEAIVTKGLEDPIASVRFAAIVTLDNLTQRQSPPSPALQDAIVKALNDPNPSTRERAVQMVTRLDDAHALAPLAKLLGEGNSNIRRQAISRLSNMTDQAAATAMVKSLDDSDAYVSRTAAIGLARMGRPEAVAALKRAAMAESEGSDNQILDALRQIGTKAVPALLEIARAKVPASRRAARILMDINDSAAAAGVAEAIKNGDAQTRRELISAMGSSRQPSSIAALSEALNDSDESVKLAAVHALGNLRTRTAVTALAKAVKDPSRTVRYEAVRAMGYSRGNGMSDDIADALAPAADDSDQQVQISAAAVLAGADSPKVVPLLCRMIEKGVLTSMGRGGDGNRSAIVQALGRPGDTRGTATLIGLLKDSNDPQVRYAAAVALGNTGGEGAGAALLACLANAEMSLREMCVISLGRLRDKNATKALQALATQEDGSLSRSVAIALARIDSKAAWKPFLAMLSHQGGDNVALAKAMEESGDDVIESLIAVLKAPASPAVFQAAYWLGELADQRAVQPLQKLMEQAKETGLGNQAYNALQMISRANSSNPRHPPYIRPRRPTSRPAIKFPRTMPSSARSRAMIS
ncbi:MAG: HEAT repeat domain-containing protein [Planctomycetaceae bacterium]|nr:HEAT repeat domain-containing protein [Planctomycetaceae bacterium]